MLNKYYYLDEFLPLILQVCEMLCPPNSSRTGNKFRKERIKFVEDAGITLKSLLVQNNPFPKSVCEKKNCLIWGSEKSGNIKFECNSNNVGYRLGCDTCAARGLIRIYEGEPFRSARNQGGGQSISQTWRMRGLVVFFSSIKKILTKQKK